MSVPPALSTPAGAIVPDDQRTLLRNRVSWGAILAGVVAPLVVQLLLNMLGIGLGASTVSVASAGDNPSAGGAGIVTAIWIMGLGIAASLVGGITAGRLSGTSDANTARWHGFVSWCVATLAIFYLLSAAAGGLIGGAAGALGSTVGAAGRGAASAVSGLAASTDGGALKAQIQRLANPNGAQAAQDNIVAYIRASVGGDKAAADTGRDRAVDSLARAANISPDEAPHPAAERRAAGPRRGRPGEAEGAGCRGGDAQGRGRRRHPGLRRPGAWRGGGMVRRRHRRAARRGAGPAGVPLGLTGIPDRRRHARACRRFRCGPDPWAMET